MTGLATVTTALKHRVRLVHAATGEAIEPIRLAPAAWPFGWAAHVAGPDAVVTSRTGAATASVTFVDVIVADGALAMALDLPPLVAGQAAGSVRVPLAAATIDVPVAPKAGVITVVLAREGSGAPSAGRTVSLRPSAGTAVPLPETATPGTYSSAARVWTAAFTPADLRIGTTTVRKVRPDFAHAETRIFVVDPT